MKRVIDILLAILGIIILLPLILITAIIVKLTSNGPVFFLQERAGYKEMPFMIWKFRSMHKSAEDAGPKLSSDEDRRVTAWGKIMRRWRLDELPQLWNVLKGDMSIVGPRPERKFFIDQIIHTHPEYLNLLKIKPGKILKSLFNWYFKTCIHLHQFPVFTFDNTRRKFFDDRIIVSDHQYCTSGFADVEKKVHDAFGSFRVKVSGWLIC